MPIQDQLKKQLDGYLNVMNKKEMQFALKNLKQEQKRRKRKTKKK